MNWSQFESYKIQISKLCPIKLVTYRSLFGVLFYRKW